MSVRGLGEGPLYGPFRDRRAAEKARDALQRRLPLRPCDYTFEPDSALPLGLGCLYAQVRSCAAPCLKRVSEEEYRGLAAQAALWLADPARRSGAPASVPASLGAAFGRAVVVDAGRRSIGLVPVDGGRVLDMAVIETSVNELEQALDRLAWPEAGAGRGLAVAHRLAAQPARACGVRGRERRHDEGRPPGGRAPRARETLRSPRLGW